MQKTQGTLNITESADTVEPFRIALPESDGSFEDTVVKEAGVGHTAPAEETVGAYQRGEERGAVQEEQERESLELASDSSGEQSDEDESYESASESERSSSLSPAQRDPAERAQTSPAQRNSMSREKRVRVSPLPEENAIKKKVRAI